MRPTSCTGVGVAQAAIARAVRARELAVAIEEATHARVVLHDERLSTVEATRIMHEKGEKARNRKGRVDELAASVILQGYLDSLERGAGC